jgi:hypothetical protein
LATAKIVMGKAPSAGGGEGGGGSGGSSGEGQKSLSSEDKLEIERASLEIAKRRLEETGYAVELMPKNNPGFDIRATKDGKVLKVEVKGHKGSARIVDLTIRE